MIAELQKYRFATSLAVVSVVLLILNWWSFRAPSYFSDGLIPRGVPFTMYRDPAWGLGGIVWLGVLGNLTFLIGVAVCIAAVWEWVRQWR